MQWIITVGYWSFLRLQQRSSLDLVLSVNAHGVILMLLLIDFLFNTYRFQYFQYSAFLVVGAIYCLLINLPYSVRVKPIYGPDTNWKSWHIYAFIFAAFIGSLAAFLISRQIYLRIKEPKLRELFKQEYGVRESTNLTNN